MRMKRAEARLQLLPDGLIFNMSGGCCLQSLGRGEGGGGGGNLQRPQSQQRALMENWGCSKAARAACQADLPAYQLATARHVWIEDSGLRHKGQGWLRWATSLAQAGHVTQWLQG